MGEDSKPKSLTDDFEKLFDLIKEGASYLLHVYLYFISKTFPLEFIENLFDHHKKSSSYDYSKEGKTYIYRLFSSIFDVEKQIVAMALQYLYSYIPLPFINTIYENFCINNNLECTDVKLKKCKKALINSSKDSKKKQKKPQNTNEDNDLVSRPFPLIPQNPESKIENRVSDPLGILSHSRSPDSDPIATGKKSIGNSESDDESSPVVVSSKKTKPIYTSAPSSSSVDATHLSNSNQKSFNPFHPSESQPHSMTRMEKLPLGNDSLPIKISPEKTPVDSEHLRGTDSSLQSSKDSNPISSNPSLTSANTFEVPKPKIQSSPVPLKAFSLESDEKPSKIPIKLPTTNVISLSPTQNEPGKSSTASSAKLPTKISTSKAQTIKQQTPTMHETKPKPKNDISLLPSTPQPGEIPPPNKPKKDDVSGRQDTPNSDYGSSSLKATPSTVKTTEAIPNPFPDLSSIFNPPSKGNSDNIKNIAIPTKAQPISTKGTSEQSPGNEGSHDLVNIPTLPSASQSNDVPPAEKGDKKNKVEKPHNSNSDSSAINQSSFDGVNIETLPHPSSDSAKILNQGAKDPSIKKLSTPTTGSSERLSENITFNASVNIPSLQPAHHSSGVPLPTKLEELGKQDTPKSKSDSSDIDAPSPKVKKIEANPNPFSDLAKIFSPPSDSNKLFSDPFTTSTTSANANSSFPTTGLDSLFAFPSAATTSSPTPTVPNIFQTPSLKTTEKSGESVAPVSKNIPPSVDFGNSFDRTIEQNNKAIQKNMEDFGKSIANVFSGGINAPTAGPSAND